MGVQVTARQLHLFKSRRQRGTLPPAPSEYQLHCAVVDTVKRWTYRAGSSPALPAARSAIL
jgi:hypothetical protein